MIRSSARAVTAVTHVRGEERGKRLRGGNAASSVKIEYL
jgi:hypothetical protein